MTEKVAKPITNGRKYGRLRVIEFHFFFFGMPIKTLGSLEKIRVGGETGNTHIYFFGLMTQTQWTLCTTTFMDNIHVLSRHRPWTHET